MQVQTIISTKPFAARLIARVNANLQMARIRREATRELREVSALQHMATTLR